MQKREEQRNNFDRLASSSTTSTNIKINTTHTGFMVEDGADESK